MTSEAIDWDRLNQLEQSIPMTQGPNCWNSILYTQNLTNEVRFSSAEELQFWLSSKYCQRQLPKDELQSGDVLIIRDSESIIHAETWLNDNLVFSKNTSHKFDPYERQLASLIFQMFRVDEQSCQIVSSEHSTACPRWTEYYRCQSAESERQTYAAKNPAYQYLQQQIKALSKTIAGDRIQPTLKNSLKLRIKHLLDSLERNDFFDRATALELESLEQQISLL